ncbi:hypothetical protein E1B28_008569 [Marasmius oreades]|uniref:Nucleoporin Nup37 n=1 Tax=Marasmius oreades TaxID=181124 RepID=A0A9P7RYN8_9AGAR|nr:uncharacterized protein E1B28_008569 [Marasmius oreades]KAG7092201.1 hypothetical protein E1B28_008569 [Marasmius oreades]
MDFSHQHSSQIYVLAACRNDDSDLIAVGGEHSVEVLLVGKTSCEQIALFHIGTRTTALAWSSRSISPTLSDDWFVELAAAGSDFSLVQLTRSSKKDENIFHFGGGLSGHHGKITDMSFCGGNGEDSARYVATVSDDKMMVVWDLYPTHSVRSPRSSVGSDASSSSHRPQPTAYVIAFPHPLTSIDSHPSSSKEFLVADCRGSIFLTDWRSDPDNVHELWRHQSLVELSDPHALSDSMMGLSVHLSASAAWRRDTPDIIGAVYGSRFSLWDTSKIYGGKPFVSDVSFSQGGHQFRWCYTYPEFFAISTQSPLKGAVIHVYNTGYVHAQPTMFEISSRPHFVRDFDFVASRGIPRLAAAVGRSVVIFPIGVES